MIKIRFLKWPGESKDVTGEKCLRDDKGNLTLSDEPKLHAWKEHY